MASSSPSVRDPHGFASVTEDGSTCGSEAKSIMMAVCCFAWLPSPKYSSTAFRVKRLGSFWVRPSQRYESAATLPAFSRRT
eukprot:scaffold144435_cov109-Phaeocystis_antarctica.AAC.2